MILQTMARGCRLAALVLAVGCAAAAEPKLNGAERHAQLNVACSACHGDGAERQTPTLKQCAVCHATTSLVAKTAKAKPTNPHVSPHYNDQLECTYCHVQHGPTEDFCAQCHSFGFKVL
ncbi:MAG: cytochrome c3 family protein [Burkholderiaceae bacterium]